MSGNSTSTARVVRAVHAVRTVLVPRDLSRVSPGRKDHPTWSSWNFCPTMKR